jgi:PAS domain S-box-containing protein
MSCLVPRESPGEPSAGIAPRAKLRRSDTGSAAARADLCLRLLIEQATECAVFMLHADGHVADWNAGCQRLFGLSPSDIVQQPLAMLLVVDEPAGHTAAELIDEAMRNGASSRLVWCRRADQTRFSARIDCRSITSPAGTMLGYACVVRDTSEGRELDRSRAEPRASGGVKPSVDAAETTSSALLSMISHEIRTPLTGIKGFTEALALQELTPLQRRYVDLTSASCTALMSVVDDLLDFSAMEAGDIDLKEEPFAVAGLAHGALSMVLGTAAPKNLALSLSIAPNVPPTVIGDRGRIRQVLLNLLANAVKFTLRGSIRLSISVETVIGGGEMLRFGVIDTGIGIPADRVPRLFNRFSQADASIRDRFGGTGLGLAICKQLAERMGGTVGVETALGRGSTFWFTIRLARAPAAAPPAVARPHGAAQARGVRVLLVEDGRMNQEIARIFLEHAGYQVRVVDDGATALAVLDAETYDIVLMDMQMPEMDGLETTRRIRARGGRFAELPIVALSARVFSEDVADCLEAGMNGHLAKPFDRVEMVSTIERFTAKAA